MIVLISCDCDGCDSTIYCKINDDCTYGRVCTDGTCKADVCSDYQDDGVNICGSGTCVNGDKPDSEYNTIYYCDCGEDSLPYYDVSLSYREDYPCTPICENHSDCIEGYPYCISGQCNEHDGCDSDEECPEGEICETKHCRTAPIGGK